MKWTGSSTVQTLIFAIVLGAARAPCLADRFYVDGSVSSSGNGLTWAEAFKTLQEALDAAEGLEGPDEIWVAAGVYRPPVGLDGLPANATYLLDDQISVIGGFFGDEASKADRLPDVHVTVLEGGIPFDSPWLAGCIEFGNQPCDEPGTGPYCDDPICCALMCNTFITCCTTLWDLTCAQLVEELCGDPPPTQVLHIVTVEGSGFSRRLDGFTVRNGDAQGGGDVGAPGGGLFVVEGGVDVIRCRFEDNRAVAGGAIGWQAVTEDFELVWMSNCVFTRNTASKRGGAIFARGPFTIVNSLFFDNSQFEEQQSVHEGGAISDAPYDTALQRRVVNCTIAFNTAQARGGGIATVASTTSETTGLEVVNCILWGNEAPTGPQLSGAPDLVAWSNIQGGEDGWTAPGSNNIDEDPEFVDAGAGDFRLTSGSPCVDTGDTETVLDDFKDVKDVNDNLDEEEPTPDLDLWPRVRAGTVSGCARVDMGAYERDQECTVGDLTEDCTVDGADLGILLGAWETNAVAPDFNCDGIVDGADLGILLGVWANEPEYPRNCCGSESLLGEGEGQNQSASEQSTGTTTVTLAVLMDLLGFTSGAQFLAWLTDLPTSEMGFWLQLLAGSTD